MVSHFKITVAAHNHGFPARGCYKGKRMSLEKLLGGEVGAPCHWDSDSLAPIPSALPFSVLPEWRGRGDWSWRVPNRQQVPDCWSGLSQGADPVAAQYDRLHNPQKRGEEHSTVGSWGNLCIPCPHAHVTQ